MSQQQPHHKSNSNPEIETLTLEQSQPSSPHPNMKTLHRRKHKKKTGRNHPKPSPENLDLLRKNLNPIAFAPAKTLDLNAHRVLLTRLGLWDFLHLNFDRSIRADLLAQLIGNYNASNRCSYVDDVKVPLNRADLGRALRLPVAPKSKKHNADEEEAATEEDIAFIEELVANWVVLHEEDTWMMPSEVVEYTRPIREGRFGKVDWAGLIWLMVSEELKKAPRVGDCYYASHLQHLMRCHKEELFSVVKEEEIDDDEEKEEEEDAKLCLGHEAAPDGDFSETVVVLKKENVECVGIGGEESSEKVDAERENVDDEQMNVDTVDTEQNNVDTVVAEQDSVDTVVAEQDSVDTVVAEQDSVDTVVAEQDNVDTIDAEQNNVDTIDSEQDNVETAVAELENVDTVVAELVVADSVDTEQEFVDADDAKQEFDDAKQEFVDKHDAQQEFLEKVDDAEQENTEKFVCETERVDVEIEDEDEDVIMDFEEYKEVKPAQWGLVGKENLGEHCLQRCNLSGVNEFSWIDSNKDVEFGEGVGEEEPDEDEIEEEEEEEEDDQEGGFSLDGFPSGNLALGMDGMPMRDHFGIDFPSPRDLMLPGSSSHYGNGRKRVISHEHDDDSLHGPNGTKRMRTDGSWDGKMSDDFETGMDRMQRWIGGATDVQKWMEKARMQYEAKANECQQASVNQQYLMQELQKRDELIEQLHTARFEEQKRLQTERFRFEHEVHLMKNLLEGYRKAIKETQKAFAEYRAQPPQDLEPLYRDVPGSGGLVLSTTELEKLRIKQEEEERMNRMAIETMIQGFEGEWIRHYETHLKNVEIASRRLMNAEKDVNSLKDVVSKKRVPETQESAPNEL